MMFGKLVAQIQANECTAECAQENSQGDQVMGQVDMPAGNKEGPIREVVDDAGR